MEGYKRLTTYVFATIIHDLTIIFCRRYIDRRSRTIDQMEQAARSGKQNIAEGYSQQSLEGYIKLLGVAFGSLKELCVDYEDFLRQRNFTIWPRHDVRIRVFRETPNLPHNPEDAANMLITFCQMETYLLKNQIEALKKKFITEGGFRENLFKERMKLKNRFRQ